MSFSKKLIFLAFVAASFAAASQSFGIFAEEVRSSPFVRLLFSDFCITLVNETTRSLTIILALVPFFVGG